MSSRIKANEALDRLQVYEDELKKESRKNDLSEAIEMKNEMRELKKDCREKHERIQQYCLREHDKIIEKYKQRERNYEKFKKENYDYFKSRYEDTLGVSTSELTLKNFAEKSFAAFERDVRANKTRAALSKKGGKTRRRRNKHS